MIYIICFCLIDNLIFEICHALYLKQNGAFCLHLRTYLPDCRYSWNSKTNIVTTNWILCDNARI